MEFFVGFRGPISTNAISEGHGLNFIKFGEIIDPRAIIESFYRLTLYFRYLALFRNGGDLKASVVDGSKPNFAHFSPSPSKN